MNIYSYFDLCCTTCSRLTFKAPLWLCGIFLGLFPFSLLSGQTYIGLSAGADLYEQVDFRVAGIVESAHNKWFSWQAELVYVKRENLEVLRNLPNDEDYVRPILSYLSIPLLAKVKLDISGANLYVMAGPQISKITSVIAFYSNNQLQQKAFSTEASQISNWDFGMHAGIGIEKEISREKKIFIEFRYYLGINDISERTNFSIYNEGKSFNLGFLIPIS